MELKISEIDLGLIMRYVVRYALGERSYAPTVVTEVITDNLDVLDNESLQTICDDIRDYATDETSLGDTKLNKWLAFRTTILKHLGEIHEPDTTAK